MGNKNQKPIVFSKLSAGLVQVAGLVVFTLILPANFTPALAANPLISQEATVIARTNLIRQQAGLPKLTIESHLMQSATNKANDMATRGYFDHGNPDGYRMAYWINGAGYTYSLAGENLAKGFSSIDRLMNAWVASPSHYKNLVEPKFTDIGVGMAEGWYENQPTLFVVQHFGVEATQMVKDTASIVSLAGPLVEAVAGATDEQTFINDGSIRPPVAPKPVVQTAKSKSVVSTPKIIEVAQASPLASDPIVPTRSPEQFWPIFALIGLALIGYLDEFIPEWLGMANAVGKKK